MTYFYRIFLFTYANGELQGIGITEDRFDTLSEAQKAQKICTTRLKNGQIVARIRRYDANKQQNIIGGGNGKDIVSLEETDTGEWIWTRMDCARAWKEFIDVYKTTIGQNNPAKTIQEAVRRIGHNGVRYALAAVTSFKTHDGRIYGANRAYMDDLLKYLPEDIAEVSHTNPMFNESLDAIHPSYINNLISSLREEEKKEVLK